LATAASISVNFIVNADLKRQTNIDAYVAERFRAARIQSGMSQEKLGDQIGVTFQQIQKYENGTNRISSGRLYQISTVLDLSITYFFDGAPKPKK
jgi:transcriptional regulator with XRE-family HTH domain